DGTLVVSLSVSKNIVHPRTVAAALAAKLRMTAMAEMDWAWIESVEAERWNSMQPRSKMPKIHSGLYFRLLLEGKRLLPAAVGCLHRRVRRVLVQSVFHPFSPFHR